ncbi:MAG: hypothetical protein AAGA48_31415 [Myxococcota bacterium]
MSPVWLAVAPWAIGPSPSAHRVVPSAQVELGGTLGLGDGLAAGGNVGVAVAPTRWAWVEAGVNAGSSVALCPDCGTRNAQIRGRVRFIDTAPFGVAVWGVGTTTGRVIDGMAGFAAEGGTRTVRFDASAPVWSSWFMLTTLRAAPEVGVAAQWSDDHRTRLSVIGLEPAIGLEHRARLGARTTLGGSLRVGEEGVRLGASLRIGTADKTPR